MPVLGDYSRPSVGSETAASHLTFQCALCNKIFSRKSVLAKHLRIHTEEKSFQCIQCDKIFWKEAVLWNTKAHILPRNHFNAESVINSFQKNATL